MPSLAGLIKKVVGVWKERGYLLGLDGRKLYPKSEHSVFNILNQSAGAIIMKKALTIADKKLKSKYSPGKEYEFILNIHDEWQLEVVDNDEIISDTRAILENSIIKAGEELGFPCPMKGNSEQGMNWSETH